MMIPIPLSMGRTTAPLAISTDWNAPHLYLVVINDRLTVDRSAGP